MAYGGGWSRGYAALSRFEPNSDLPYEKIKTTLAQVRKNLNNRPLTLAEKVVYGHLDDPLQGELI